MKYRAKFSSYQRTVRTRFYPSREQAQSHLQSRIGWFRFLGEINGDAAEPGRPCDAAPRNGGLVTIEERE